MSCCSLLGANVPFLHCLSVLGRQRNKHKRGTAFGHAGIVASASAVLADLEKGGILRVLLGGDEERETMDEEGGADNKGEAVGAIMQEKVDAKVR